MQSLQPTTTVLAWIYYLLANIKITNQIGMHIKQSAHSNSHAVWLLGYTTPFQWLDLTQVPSSDLNPTLLCYPLNVWPHSLLVCEIPGSTFTCCSQPKESLPFGVHYLKLTTLIRRLRCMCQGFEASSPPLESGLLASSWPKSRRRMKVVGRCRR